MNVGISDIITIIHLASEVYNNYRNSGNEFKQLTTDIELFKTLVERFEQTHRLTQLDTHEAECFQLIIDNSEELLADLNKFRKKVCDHENNVLRKWGRLRWDPKKYKDLEKRIHDQTLIWTAYNSSITSMFVLGVRNNPHSVQEQNAPSSHEVSTGRLSESSTTGVSSSRLTGDTETFSDFLDDKVFNLEPIAFNPLNLHKKTSRARSESNANIRANSSVKPRSNSHLGWTAVSIGQEHSPFQDSPNKSPLKG